MLHIIKIFFLGMNMPFISSCEARKCKFIRGSATHEKIYAFFASIVEINDIFIPKI